MGKVRYKVQNWPEYNKSLKNRYNLTLWVDESATTGLPAQTTGKRGRPFVYSSSTIEVCLVVRSLFRLPLRGVEGLMRSIARLIHLPVPDYTVLSRRGRRLKIDLAFKPRDSAIHLVVDSTGLKIYGEGEWKVRIHGIGKRRTWRKIHIGLDEATGEIVCAEFTKADTVDSDVLPKILRKIGLRVLQVSADGAYDRRKDYKAIARMGARAVIPPRWDAVVCSRGRPSERDVNIERIRKIGLKRWKVESQYHRRSLTETAFSRLKRIFGGGLRSRLFENQRTEAMIALNLLNRMTALGMPNSIPAN